MCWSRYSVSALPSSVCGSQPKRAFIPAEDVNLYNYNNKNKKWVDFTKPLQRKLIISRIFPHCCLCQVCASQVW